MPMDVNQLQTIESHLGTRYDECRLTDFVNTSPLKLACCSSSYYSNSPALHNTHATPISQLEAPSMLPV